MKKEQFYELLGEVDEKAVNDAEKAPVKQVKRIWMRYTAVVAACLLVITGAGIWYMHTNQHSSISKNTANKNPGTEYNHTNEPLPTKNETDEPIPTVNETDEPNPTENNPGYKNKMLLAAAIYPAMPPYPDGSQKAYKEWHEAKLALRNQPEGYDDGFDTFFSNSTRTFLSGAGTENIVYSPLSLYMALGMSAEISDGNTRQQILDVLAQDDIDTLRSHARSIWQANYMDDGMAKCILATSLWTNDNITYHQNTFDSLAKNYYSSVFSGDPSSDEYNKLLQDWLNEQTDGLLDNFISDIKMNPETVLMLASTVNYSGKWNNKFSGELTKPDVFHSPDGAVQCDFMNAERTNSYSWGKKFSAVSLGLENNGEMRLILPDEGFSPEDLIKDDELIGYMMNWYDYTNSKYVLVNISVPKFDVSSNIDLKDGLNKLGITDIFDPTKSDFSPLTENADGIAISKAEQNTRVLIDEEGCKAASLTVMDYNGSGMPKEQVDFTLDRPFIFEIMSENGLPLFVGIVNNPIA